MRVKSVNPPAAYFSTSPFSTPSRSSAVLTMLKASRCGRCEVIASTLSWCAASITSTLDPSARHSAATCSVASASVTACGVRMHQRFSNSRSMAAAGPDSSVPATGMARHEAPHVEVRRHQFDDFPLHRSDVGHERVGAQARRHRPRRLAAGADRHAEHHQICILHGRGGVGQSPRLPGPMHRPHLRVSILARRADQPLRQGRGAGRPGQSTR